ncbi:MAG: hypothetical protein K2M62_01560 [Muribaculaceae bacterium]|nr:hypothetical protein [Muribaculaceae bacterium]
MDLTRKFPEDKGYSVRNLRYMRRFAENYPNFPILQAALAELADGKNYVDVPLTTVSWYHIMRWMMPPSLTKMAGLRQTAAYTCAELTGRPSALT